jgi:hypothetical protein
MAMAYELLDREDRDQDAAETQRQEHDSLRQRRAGYFIVPGVEHHFAAPQREQDADGGRDQPCGELHEATQLRPCLLDDDEEAEVPARVHAGRGPEHHRRAHAEQRERLGPAGRIVQHVAREHLPRLNACHRDERDARDADSCARQGLHASPRMPSKIWRNDRSARYRS